MNYNYFIPILAFFGLITGLLLRKIVTEEVISGKKYLKFISKAILFILLIGLLYYAKLNYFYLFLGVIFGFLLATFAEDYVFMGLSLVTAFFISKEAIFLISILVFIYGLPFGSLNAKTKEILFVIKNILYFFSPFLILYFFYDYVSNFSTMLNFILGVSCGGLFNLFLKRQ